MPSKLYFYDEQGREIDHPYNGATYCSGGSAIAVDRKLACETTAPLLRDGRGRFGRVELEVELHGPRRKTFVTAKDFGLRRLLVKHWTPDPEYREWFWLVDRPELVRHA